MEKKAIILKEVSGADKETYYCDITEKLDEIYSGIRQEKDHWYLHKKSRKSYIVGSLSMMSSSSTCYDIMFDGICYGNISTGQYDHLDKIRFDIDALSSGICKDENALFNEIVELEKYFHDYSYYFISSDSYKKTVVISAFPGCGKTYAYTNKFNNYSMLDSDSSSFSWAVDDNGVRVRDPEFPANYVEHIKKNIGIVDVIYVSSHEEVRQALHDAGIKFALVYPSVELKNEFIGKYYMRGNSKEFISFISGNWEKFINDIESTKLNCTLFRLAEIGNSNFTPNNLWEIVSAMRND